MIVQCAQCNTRYQLDASRIPRQQIRVRCPGCRAVFAIDGREADQLVGAGVAHQASAASAPVAPVAPRPAPAPTAGYGEITLDSQGHTPVSEPVAEAVAPPAPPAPAPVSAPVAPVEEAPSASLDFEIERASDPPLTGRPEAGFGSQQLEQSASAQPTAGTAAATADPADEKCRRLARALVSDILVYNRDVRDKALSNGNLVQALGVEIKKSWELYKEKVTPEVANSNNYFREALNEILADGQKIF